MLQDLVVAANQLEDEAGSGGVSHTAIHTHVTGVQVIDAQGARLGHAHALGGGEVLPVLQPADGGPAAVSQRTLDDHRGLGQKIGTPSDGEVEPLLRPCLDVGAVVTQNSRTGLAR